MSRIIGYVCTLALVAGCTQSFKPDNSTETGNPPVIDSSKIALVVTRDEVHVRGEAGAVMPPDAEVEVTILRTGEVERGDVARDGSFDVEVNATLDDVFEVRAVLGDLRSGVVIVDRGGAMVGDGDGGMLSCEEQTSRGSAALDEALAAADRSCEADSDCMVFYRTTECSVSCFGGFFSEQGIEALAEAVEEINASVCAGFEEKGCELVVPPCVPPRAGECVNGQCTDNTGGACESCLSTEISWRVVDTGVFPAEPAEDVHTLSGCNTYTRDKSAGSCSSDDVPQCPGIAMAASISDVEALLVAEEISEARALGGTQGEPQSTGGYAYEITIGGDTFVYRTCSGVVGVACLPRGPVQQLVELLAQMISESSCDIVADRCTAPFEVGECDAAIAVWWHDTELGECVPKTYGGCGGNSNRFASQAECEQACGVAGGECPPDRVPVEECVMCGPAGGCAMTGRHCARLCTQDADCEDQPGSLGLGSTCDEAAGVCRSIDGCI